MSSIETGCKINLYLRVTGCRADGYHTLDTVFWPLSSPSDTLECVWDAAPGIAFDSPGMAPSPDNLVLRAARSYAEAAGIAPSWRITLQKRVPVAAGLGGGSADAGAMLSLLQEHYRALPPETLKACAAKLGADVPFFLLRKPVRAGGTGDEFSPLATPLTLPPLLLVSPEFPVRAVWAYRVWRDAGGPDPELLLEGLRERDPRKVAAGVFNDLGRALFAKFPLLRRLRKTLLDSGALAVEVSGSGPVLFAVMPDSGICHEAALRLQNHFTGLRIYESGETTR